MSLHRILAFSFLAAAQLATHGVCFGQRSANIYGVGGVTCGEYIEHRKQNSKAMDYSYVSWMNGYASGYNQFSPSPQVASLPPPPTILAYLDKYCREKPLNPVKWAADDLLIELGARLVTPGQAK